MRSNKKHTLIYGFIFIVIFATILTLYIVVGKSKPAAKDGFIDLSQWNFIKDGNVELSGDWKFKWMEDDPAFSRPDYDDSGWDELKMPGVWNYKTKSAFGYGWLRLKIKLKPQERICLYFSRLNNPMVFFVNGEKLFEFGKAGNNRADTVSDGSYNSVHTLQPGMEMYVLAWKISNFHLPYGGTLGDIQLGTEITPVLWYDYFLMGALGGVALIMACYHFILWLAGKRDKSSLYFTIMCLVKIARDMLALGIINWGSAFAMNSAMILDFDVKSGIVQQIIFALLFLFFIKALYKEIIDTLFLRIMQKIILIFAVLMLMGIVLLPAWILSLFVAAYYICNMAIYQYVCVILLKAVRQERSGAGMLLCGSICAFVFWLHDMLLTIFFIPVAVSFQLTAYIMIILIIFQAMAKAKSIGDTFRTAAHLSRNLEQEVKQQTIQLTEQKETLVQVNRQLKMLDTYKTQFFQNITHELRTPLTLIIGPIENILKKQTGIPAASDKAQLEMVRHNAYQLLDLINQILDLARLDSGAQKPYMEKIDFRALVNFIYASFDSLAKNKNITYECVSPLPEVVLVSDKNKIIRILTNILSNAFKFTASGGKITMAMDFPAAEAEHAVKITITDTGIGIPEKALPHIFERFRQADGSTTRMFGGTGIGLALVREYVDLLGGRISVTSKEGAGTTFVIILPGDNAVVTENPAGGTDILMQQFAAAQPGLFIKQEITENNGQDRSPKILIVDDNCEIRNYITSVLRDKYRVFEAENGETGWQQIGILKPDVVLADIMMPVIDGYRLVRMIREDDATRYLPVIMITAKSISGQAEHFGNYVPDDFLFKPFTGDELLNRIELVLLNSGTQNPLDKLWKYRFSLTDKQDTGPLPADSKYDPAHKSILLVEDNPALLTYLHAQMTAQYNIYCAVDGKAALEKLSGIPKPDLVISDVMMAPMDGNQFYRHLADHPVYRDIPFIFITARNSAYEKIQSLQAGVVDYIYKPFAVAELAARIASVIRYDQLRKSLYEKDKYASLGLLLSGISHEILNPLSGITGPIGNLRRLLNAPGDNNGEINADLEIMERNTKRISDLVKSLRALYYQDTVHKQSLDLAEIMDSIMQLFADKIRDKIQIMYAVEPDFALTANTSILSHILINLITNAIDSISGRGTIRILARKRGNRSTLHVIDSGKGMSADILQNIFNPFYTTKETGKGIGLGLYIVKDLVLRMGWEIEVQSKVGEGSEFTIIL